MEICFKFKSMNSFDVSSILDSTQSDSTTNLTELLDLVSHDLGHDDE